MPHCIQTNRLVERAPHGLPSACFFEAVLRLALVDAQGWISATDYIACDDHRDGQRTNREIGGN